MPSIFWITGPPAAGKTTLCEALLTREARGYHIEVDRLRLGVISGLADAVPWTEETERQFQVAEEAACDLALRYYDSGFSVAIDHCRNLARCEELIQRRLAHAPIVKVCLLPELGENLRRNAGRTNKSFDPEFLTDTIRFVNDSMHESEVPPGWLILRNTHMSLDEEINAVNERAT